MEEDLPETYTAEFRDGQLQIIEVASGEDEGDTEDRSETEPMPSTSGIQDDSDNMKYIQVVDSTGNQVMHLDLLNFTLVKCQDDPESEYRLVANSELNALTQDEGVGCIVTSDEDEEPVAEESYVLTDAEDTYVMVEKDHGPAVLLKNSADNKIKAVDLPKPVATPAQIIERAKALQKAKALKKKKGPVKKGVLKPIRPKKKSDLPSHEELLAYPNFKLFLYSCKVCDFKCNAIKELTDHKAKSHVGRKKINATQMKIREGLAAKMADYVQRCRKCPYLTYSQVQLGRHIKDKHTNKKEPIVFDNEDRDSPGDILVCGACGFESTIKNVFKSHIDTVHRAQVSL